MNMSTQSTEERCPALFEFEISQPHQNFRGYEALLCRHSVEDYQQSYNTNATFETLHK